jgi:poly-gamma-glutamate capsule biosynthesis protein CapA/YwtB (metallophosphatase superfamily)
VGRTSPPAALPRTARDLVRLDPFDRVAYGATLALFRLSGLWKHPQPMSGDLETMGFLDKAYWLHKTNRPMRTARRGSGLEAYFARQERASAELPVGFRVRSRAEISAVGDLMSHPFLAGSKESLYADIADLVFGTDLAMANLECPVLRAAARALTIHMKEGPPLHYDPASFEAARGRFGFMATACNHSLDFGLEGVASTLEALAKAGIAQSGLNRDEAAASEVAILERNGIRIGVVAYTFGLNARRPPASRPNLVNRMPLNEGVAANDFSRLRGHVASARAGGVEFLIAHFHWGMEQELYPTPEQVELAHEVAELGFDAIIGHHPHVVQPMEHYRTRRDPLRTVPVMYSLGNLVNPFTAPYLVRSAVARLTLEKGELDGVEKVYVSSAELRTVVQQVDLARRQLRLRPA